MAAFIGTACHITARAQTPGEALSSKQSRITLDLLFKDLGAVLKLQAQMTKNAVQSLRLPDDADEFHASDLMGQSDTDPDVMTLNRFVVLTNSCGHGIKDCGTASASLIDKLQGVLVMSWHQLAIDTDGNAADLNITRFDGNGDTVCTGHAAIVAYNPKLDLAFAAMNDQDKNCAPQALDLPRGSDHTVLQGGPQRLMFAGYSAISDGDGNSTYADAYDHVYAAYDTARLHARVGYLWGKPSEFLPDTQVRLDKTSALTVDCKMMVQNNIYLGMSGGPAMVARAAGSMASTTTFAGIINATNVDALDTVITPVEAIVNAYHYIEGIGDARQQLSLPASCRYNGADWHFQTPIGRNVFSKWEIDPQILSDVPQLSSSPAMPLAYIHVPVLNVQQPGARKPRPASRHRPKPAHKTAHP